MTEFEAFEDSAEVNGQTILAFVAGVPAGFEDKAFEILAQYGIEDPEPDEWYSQQAWLDAFEEIDSQVGDATLNRIGEEIPQNADWPSSSELVVIALDLINEAYQMNHRNGEIGYYRAERVDDETVEVSCKNPYPCTFDKGIVRAVAEEAALQEDVFFTEISDHCRSDGGEECLYQIEL
jgi:hypothetical protein